MSKKASQKTFPRVKYLVTAILPLITWMAFIFVLSNRQKIAFTDNYPVSFSIFKSLHMLEYGVLFLLWARVLRPFSTRFFLITALLLTFAYGLSDELHQSFIVGREGKLFDACVDALGGIVTWWLLTKFTTLKRLILSL